uniref:uncharacterized protein LOC120331949 isoform X2 n=1 Tax=Styela clava TaxID=7725 RepID=UPI00193ABEC7|nr:uncharacterized protein LOC120331949 isoform X2 [Styela clava]
MCLNDKNGCRDDPCFEGVECIDVPAPGTGFQCEKCPRGYLGDGIVCYAVCDEPIIDNGQMIAGNISVGSSVTFECNKGFELVGQQTITCGNDNEYDSPVPTCEAAVSIEYFNCDVLGNDTIRVSWLVPPKWRNSLVIDQFIVSWNPREDLSYDTEEELKTYFDEFDDYEEKLNDVIETETVPSLKYRAIARNESSFIITNLRPSTLYFIRLRMQITEGLVENPTRSCVKVTGEGREFDSFCHDLYECEIIFVHFTLLITNTRAFRI